MKRLPRVEVFRDKHRQWRWRVRGANSRIVCTPGEAFTRRRDAVRAFRRVEAILCGPMDTVGFGPEGDE